MRRLSVAALLLFVLDLASVAQSVGPRRPEQRDTGGVLRQLSIASFGGSGQTSIQALATDLSGNILVAGTTNSLDFPVKNAAQPAFGDATILRTTDLGTTWTRVGSPPGPVVALVPDPVAPQILFAGTTTSIFKSSDGGQTWQSVYTFPPPPRFAVPFNGALVIDTGNHLHLATVALDGSILRSLDGGATWSGASLSQGCGASQLIADPNGSGTLVALAFTAPICISRDWGLTFKPIGPSGSPPPGNTEAVTMVPSHPGWIYLGAGYGVFGSLFLSTDYGATWVNKTSPSTTFSAFTALAVDPDQPSVLVADTLGGFFKSTDGGSSWMMQGGAFGGPGGPGMQTPLALVSHQCSPTGGLFTIVSGPGYFAVAFSPDDGATFATAQLSHVTNVVAGPNCVAYAIRQPGGFGSDAFVAKLTPDGQTLWATYLGGSDIDAPVALAVDPQGNAYVAGNTASPDFPATVPRIGMHGQSAAFVARYSPDGKLSYSVVIGGEARDTVYGMALDLNQNVHLLGYTDSLSFPVTPGALVPKLDAGSYTGFLLKLSPNAGLVFSTYLGESYTHPGAIFVGADEQPIVTGNGPPPGTPPAPEQGNYPDFLVKLDATGSRVVQTTLIPGSGSSLFGPTGLGADAAGNLIVFGATESVNFPTTPGAYTAPPTACGALGPYYNAGAEYVTKLRAADWSVIYSVLLPCGGQSGTMAIDRTGAVVLATQPGVGFPLHTPLVGAPGCGNAAVARLSADGSALQFSTYVDSCGASSVPGLALAADGSVYVGVSNLSHDRTAPTGTLASVLHLLSANPPAISLDQISNAFSGDSSGVVGGGLYSLTVSGLQPPPIDLGLNPSHDLPTQLGGVQVIFDGVPAAILRTGPGQVIVAPPWILPAHADARSQTVPRHLGNEPAFTLVQVIYNGVRSNAVWMPVSIQNPGLLTNAFPGHAPSGFANFPDGNVRNQDGTQNDAAHPAALGSTITVFATGFNIANPAGAPGAVAASNTLFTGTNIYSSWARYTSTSTNLFYPPETVYSLPGFISDLFQIPIKIPASFQFLNGTGTDAGNGVQRVPFYLTPYSPLTSSITPQPTSFIGVYLK